MQRPGRTQLLTSLGAAAVALTLLVPSALAAGGTGGGGGVGGGATAGPCVAINSWKATAGYRPSSSSSVGAVWVDFRLNACATATPFVVHIDETNAATGELAWGFATWASSGKIDNDWVPLSTTYHIAITVTDGSGAVLQSESADVTTPTKKAGTL